jgi:hypothetical protein
MATFSVTDVSIQAILIRQPESVAALKSECGSAGHLRPAVPVYPNHNLHSACLYLGLRESYNSKQRLQGFKRTPAFMLLPQKIVSQFKFSIWKGLIASERPT